MTYPRPVGWISEVPERGEMRTPLEVRARRRSDDAASLPNWPRKDTAEPPPMPSPDDDDSSFAQAMA
jgi:hypothetical protein